jgi:peptidyl-prolyl cis-trans isomerase B (cyclophilin B)
MRKLSFTILAAFAFMAGCKEEGQKTEQKMEATAEVQTPPQIPQAGKPEDPSNPQVVLETDSGKIVLELFPKEAPITVENFLKLVNQKFYDGLTFHRVIPGFMIQGGDPKGDGSGGPGWTIKGEFGPRKHLAGTLSMARTPDPNSAGSQFFICVDSASYLNGQYAAFGQTVEGLEVARKIVSVPRDQRDKPLAPIHIKRAYVKQ